MIVAIFLLCNGLEYFFISIILDIIMTEHSDTKANLFSIYSFVLIDSIFLFEFQILYLNNTMILRQIELLLPLCGISNVLFCHRSPFEHWHIKFLLFDSY